MWLSLCAVFVCVLWLSHWLVWRGGVFGSSKKLPPSFYGLPLVGNLPLVFWNRKPVSLAKRTAQKHGPVYRVRLGWMDVVVVNGAAAVKEALKNDDLLGRPKLAFFELLKKLLVAKPFIAMEGEHWKAIRNQSVHALRDLGFGKTPVMERKVQEEIDYFVRDLSATGGQPHNPRQSLLASVSNNIATLVFGDRLPLDHPKRRNLNAFLLGFLEAAGKFIVFSFAPTLLRLLVAVGIKPVQRFLHAASLGKAMFDQELRDHTTNYDGDDKRDFLDHLISKQHQDPNVFTPNVVRGSMIVFFGAGSNTTRVAVEYLMQLAAAHPQLQEQMYQEIKSVMGDSRPPCWADKDRLHLVNAFIHERHRVFPVAPMGVFRKALCDTKIAGFDVAKGTIVIYNVASVHSDFNEFDRPQEFRPSRFLDSEGKFVPGTNVMPFAIGKRACPGETFAVFEIFLYFSAIVQRFRILPAADAQQVELSRAEKFLAEPVEQKLRFVSRT